MTTEAKTGATHLVEGQAGHTLANDAINRLGSLVSLLIIDRDLNTPPGSPTQGDTYIIGSSPTGDWATHAGKVTTYYNGWIKMPPKGGMTGFVADEKIWIGYSSVESLWHPLQLIASTTEYWTGTYRGGSKVYAKLVSLGSLPNTTLATVAHGITGLDQSKGVTIQGSAYNSSLTTTVSLPLYFSSFSLGIDIYLDGTNISVVSNFDASGYVGEILITYCKT